MEQEASGRLDHQGASSEPPRTPELQPADTLNEDQQGMQPAQPASPDNAEDASADSVDHQGGERPSPSGEVGRQPIAERDRDYDPDGDRLGT